MVDYAFILTKNHPGKQWSMDGDEYSGITWHDDIPIPQQQLDDEWRDYLDEKEATQYKEDRLKAYESSGASILDVVEALREHIAEGRPERLAAIQAIVDQIKIDIPKPESKVGEE